ncbi:raffinose/stachyose/melibiose transport system permease protein [Agromyces cerinus]|uniref:Carbohydrate ABC transporter membrane protein 2, CUT1 family n=1 Tax=Agromyces cerinus subsp. cerinus TaxID=232089 RepID=A0A1N6EV37_9MICO|nr:carbohydrate ABC transporter permease [Agromyces cerinus]MBM7832860.1 raffinose/stachyose/melibiose transport system permease protein [Agromyces cerinus]SIN86868.1 carbohydrate ABC transporter membrane protein 2, CUT1 family [Agromyces cerinus subsp. cerinus]
MTATITPSTADAQSDGRDGRKTGRPNGGAPRRRPKVTAGGMASSVFLWLYAAISIAPLLLMVSNSLRTTQDMATKPLGLPLPPDFTSYQKAWITASFDTYFFNSIFVTVASVLLSTVVSLLAAYAFARTKSKLFTALEGLFLSGLMLPVYLAILPLFFLLDAAGMISNLWGLILVYGALGIPFSTFVLSSFFRQLPIELDEAARLDGAGPFQTFWRVHLPLVKPAIATVVVFRFVPVWNDFFYPLILIRDQDSYTLPVGITRFFGEYQTDWATLFAGLTLATIPLVVLFLLATKQIVSGLTAGMSK